MKFQILEQKYFAKQKQKHSIYLVVPSSLYIFFCLLDLSLILFFVSSDFLVSFLFYFDGHVSLLFPSVNITTQLRFSLRKAEVFKSSQASNFFFFFFSPGDKESEMKDFHIGTSIRYAREIWNGTSLSATVTENWQRQGVLFFLPCLCIPVSVCVCEPFLSFMERKK